MNSNNQVLINVPLVAVLSRSANVCPMMMLASVRRTLTSMMSLVDIIDDNNMRSWRVVSSCLWRRGTVGRDIVTLERRGSGGG